MKPSEIFEGENSSLKKTYDEATKTFEEILEEAKKEFSNLPLYISEEDLIEKFINQSFQAGKDSIKEEIFDFIMKNLYNEQTCEKINEFFNKIK